MQIASSLGLDKAAWWNLVEQIVPYYQPIYSLSERRVVGFEALARLRADGGLLLPVQFLHTLDAERSLELFYAMLAKGIALLRELEPAGGDFYVAINVDASLLLHRDFVEMIRFVLSCHDGSPERLVIEILEGEAITDVAATVRTIRRLKALGFTVALDDVGSAYASLIHIKDLPVDVLKLDQNFSRQLERRPEDLQFISSMLGLARGLDRKLVVEGVESPDVLEALRILGVEYVQGYCIARPMDGSAVAPWLEDASFPPPGPSISSMLGVYAAHLTVVEACRVLAKQPLRLRWHEDAADPHRCKIGRYFDKHGLHDTGLGRAHKQFHHALALNEGSSEAWRLAAEDLRRHLLKALRRGPGRPAKTFPPTSRDDDVL